MDEDGEGLAARGRPRADVAAVVVQELQAGEEGAQELRRDLERVEVVGPQGREPVHHVLHRLDVRDVSDGGRAVQQVDAHELVVAQLPRQELEGHADATGGEHPPRLALGRAVIDGPARDDVVEVWERDGQEQADVDEEDEIGEEPPQVARDPPVRLAAAELLDGAAQPLELNVVRIVRAAVPGVQLGVGDSVEGVVGAEGVDGLTEPHEEEDAVYPRGILLLRNPILTQFF